MDTHEKGQTTASEIFRIEKHVTEKKDYSIVDIRLVPENYAADDEDHSLGKHFHNYCQQNMVKR